jgi:hypothetical protein
MKTISIDTSYFDEEHFLIFDTQLQKFEAECGLVRVGLDVKCSRFGPNVLGRTPLFKPKGKIETYRKMVYDYYPVFLTQYPKFNFSRRWK